MNTTGEHKTGLFFDGTVQAMTAHTVCLTERMRGKEMTMFPDCRNDDAYNEDFLSEMDRQVVSGFDIAAEVVENCFDNLDDEDLFGRIAQNEMVQSLIETIKTNFRDELASWLESERNMLITSLLDGTEQEEYDKLRAQALKEHPDKEYYDTRKFMCTGIKEFRKE